MRAHKFVDTRGSYVLFIVSRRMLDWLVKVEVVRECEVRLVCRLLNSEFFSGFVVDL